MQYCLVPTRRRLTSTSAWRSLVALGVALALCGLSTREANAQKKGKDPADVLAGQAILSPKMFPASFASDREFLRVMRRMKTRTFRSTKKGVWAMHFMAFFPVELQQMTCELHFFDVTKKKATGKSIYVESRTQLLGKRGERTLAGTLYLNSPLYQKDHTYRLIISRQDRGILADAYFTLREAHP